jgi:paraquat-inducible protein B
VLIIGLSLLNGANISDNKKPIKIYFNGFLLTAILWLLEKRLKLSIFSILFLSATSLACVKFNNEPYVLVQRVVINFKDSVRGLSVGAPVEFRGVRIGEVAHIGLAFDLKTFVATQPVEVNLYPETMLARSSIDGAIIAIPKTKEGQTKRLKTFVDNGLRAQLRSLSLLTGEKYIGLDFYPHAPKYTFDMSKEPYLFQAVPGKFNSLEQSVTDVLANTDKLLKKLDADIVPELKQVLINVDEITTSDSPLLIDIRDSLRELTKAANSIKILADMLDQQPQSLIYGKPLKDSQ